MKTMFANFSAVALSRAEMKKVTGGNCYVQGVQGPVGGGKSGAKALANSMGPGTHYCCASCGSASWCKGC